MGRQVSGGLWIERSGDSITIGITKQGLGTGALKSIESLPVGSTVKPGGPLLLATVGKKEIEFDSPVAGKIIELRPGLAKGGGVGDDPDASWVVKLRGGAVADDEDDDDDEDDVFDDEDEDDED